MKKKFTIIKMFRKINYIFSNDLIDFKKIISGYIWVLENQPKKKDLNKFTNIFLLIKFFLRTIFNSIATTPVIIFPKIEKKISIFYIRKHVRPDLYKHSQFYENIEGTTVCIFKNRKIKIDIINFIKCFFFLFKYRKSWLKVFTINRINFFSLDGIKIFLVLFDSLSDAFKSFPYLLNHTKLVSFQDHVAVENILCQFANLSKIETYALQHAIDTYSEQASYELNLTNITYSNLVCKNVLAWGEYSKNIFKKMTNAKVFIVGKPSIQNEKPLSGGVTFIFESKECPIINSKLLKMSFDLANSGINVSRWFKPNHILIKGSVTRDGKISKIIIGSNSSFCVELGFLGFKVFLLEKSNIRNLIPDTLIAENFNLIKDKDKLLDNYPHKIWKYFIECSGEESVKRYKKILEIDS